MSTSSDVEKLFKHFGGDEQDYQEIGRENDAKVARSCWPLLTSLNLSPPQVPPVEVRTAPDPAPTPPAKKPQPVRKNLTGAAGETRFALRAGRPLVTPVRPTPVVRGAARFSAPPASAAVDPPAAPVQLSAAQPVVKPVAPGAPVAATAAVPAVTGTAAMPASRAAGPQAAIKIPVQAPPVSGAVPPAVPPVVPSVVPSVVQAAAPARVASAPVAPSAPAPAAPASILGKLFKPSPSAAAASTPTPLQAVFQRLQGAAADKAQS
jgi:hypothetical protein